MAPEQIAEAERMAEEWESTDSPAMLPVRLLCPQQPTFQPASPLWLQFRPLHLQERTFLLASLEVRS